MEKSNLLQRPGGLGPMNAMQPLGGTGIQSPAAYAVTPEMIAVRRAAGMDNINRVMAQYSRDRARLFGLLSAPQTIKKGISCLLCRLRGLLDTSIVILWCCLIDQRI
jgi:hypothetical protein